MASLQDDADTIAAAAQLEIRAAALLQDGADAIAATFELAPLEGGEISAAVNLTDAGDGLAAAATLAIAASAAALDSADALSAAAGLRVSAAVVLVDAGDGLAAAATLAIAAGAALADQADTLGATFVLTGGPERQASATLLDAGDALTATLDLEGEEAPAPATSPVYLSGSPFTRARRAARRRSSSVPELRVERAEPVVVVLAPRMAHVMVRDADDELVAEATIRDSAKNIGRRRALPFLLLS